MQLWLVLLGCGAMLVLIALFGALRLELSARGFGEPSGAWALAFGVGTSLGALSGVAGKGTPLALELHVLGQRLPLRRRKRVESAHLPDDAEKASSRESAGARIQRWLRSPPSAEPLLRAGRRVELEELSLDAAYGFGDIALTGRVAGVLYALSGALPSRVRLSQRPSWDGSERWELNLAGCLRLYPALVLLELLWYMLRARRQRRSARPAQPALENPS